MIDIIVMFLITFIEIVIIMPLAVTVSVKQHHSYRVINDSKRFPVLDNHYAFSYLWHVNNPQRLDSVYYPFELLSHCLPDSISLNIVCSFLRFLIIITEVGLEDVINFFLPLPQYYEHHRHHNHHQYRPIESDGAGRVVQPQ